MIIIHLPLQAFTKYNKNHMTFFSDYIYLLWPLMCLKITDIRWHQVLFMYVDLVPFSAIISAHSYSYHYHSHSRPPGHKIYTYRHRKIQEKQEYEQGDKLILRRQYNPDGMSWLKFRCMSLYCSGEDISRYECLISFAQTESDSCWKFHYVLLILDCISSCIMSFRS